MTHLQDMHEVFEYPFPLRLQSHVFEGGLFQEPVSDLEYQSTGNIKKGWK